MSLYTLALFVHVSGAIGAFISLGVWLFGLAALRRARLIPSGNRRCGRGGGRIESSVN